MTVIKFETKLYKINNWIILRLPEESSSQLPTRGMLMVKGTFNNIPFKTLLEPDGKYGPGLKPSHWFSPDKKLLNEAGVKVGDTVQVSLEPTKEWINPVVPPDMKKALVADKEIHKLWNDITPLARWDWVRWVRAVKSEETRKKHVDIMISKLSKGMRRPCCFNRNLCSEPSVSHNWALQEPN